jgi:hypothetical protein
MDKPKIMLASVVANVSIRSIVGVRARSACCFAFIFCRQSLNHEDEGDLIPFNFNFNFNYVDLKPYFT